VEKDCEGMTARWAHNYAQAATPAFRDADSHGFDFGREVAQQSSGGGMKSQRGRNQIYDWRRVLIADLRRVLSHCSDPR
jgi:hypothetical protein